MADRSNTFSCPTTHKREIGRVSIRLEGRLSWFLQGGGRRVGDRIGSMAMLRPAVAAGLTLGRSSACLRLSAARLHSTPASFSAADRVHNLVYPRTPPSLYRSYQQWASEIRIYMCFNLVFTQSVYSRCRALATGIGDDGASRRLLSMR